MISVYGGNGFIGSKFCKLNANDVIKIDRDSREPKSDNVLYFISTIDNYNVFDNLQIDIDTNLKVLMEVLNHCKDKNITFNFVSSWFVYGKTDKLPANENDYCNPKGFYSITKRTAEQMLISFCETFGVNYRIFRLANVYGEGDLTVSNKKNALQYLINEIVNGNDINLYDGGMHIRDFIYVDDVCDAIKLCMDKADMNDIINIGSGKPNQFLDLMEYCKEQIDSKSKLITVRPTKFHDIVQVKDMYLDTTKLKNLGFKPKVKIEDGLDKIIKEYRSNR